MPIRAVQQFQLGTVMNKEEQALETMAKMKAAGYEGIELKPVLQTEFQAIQRDPVYYKLGSVMNQQNL